MQMVDKDRVERPRLAKNLIRGQVCDNCHHYHYSLRVGGVANVIFGYKVRPERAEKEYCEKYSRNIPLFGNLMVRAIPEFRTCEEWTEQV